MNFLMKSTYLIFFFLFCERTKPCLYASELKKSQYEWNVKNETAMFVEILQYIVNLEVKVALDMLVSDLHQD